MLTRQIFSQIHSIRGSCAPSDIRALLQQPVERTKDAHSREAQQRGVAEVQKLTAGPAKHAGPTKEQERRRKLYPSSFTYRFYKSN